MAFDDLTLAVIDEQHRFGVHQRLTLAAKGHGVDVLVMTATPIPRTLMLTAYGDMDVSRLPDKPAGRQPGGYTGCCRWSGSTTWWPESGRSLEGGAKIYWVCPAGRGLRGARCGGGRGNGSTISRRAIGESRVTLVHGRMKGAEKDAAMQRFAEGPPSVLVATTVIEVGVDVPDATVMVIEHAERFGLAQLHQLRGRIGRGSKASTCLLLYAQAAERDGAGPARHHARDRRRFPHRRGGPETARRRRTAGNPSERPGPSSGSRISPSTPTCWPRARDDASLILERDPDLKSEPRNGPAHPALPVRARRSGALPAFGVV